MANTEELIVPTALSVLNGAGLCFVYVLFPNLRRNSWVQGLTWLYLAVSFSWYMLQLPVVESDAMLAHYWLYLVAFIAYMPVVTYLGAAFLEGCIQLLGWGTDRENRRLQRWRKHLLSTTSKRDRRMLERKLKELKRSPVDPVVRRELVELYLSRGDVEHALYHSYALIELLPPGHSHAFALYRLAQILVDQLGALEEAQPYLRRIIRCYPKSFFASYGRRLVNQYEAYADR